MSATITASNGAGSTTPRLLIVPYETSWTSRNVIHDLTGGDIAVSIVTPRPRAGDLIATYSTAAEAFACAQLHQQPTTFDLTDTDVPEVSMTYVIDKRVTVRVDEETQKVWIVTIGYQELSP